MNRSHTGSVGRIFATLLAAILIMGLAGIVGYLLSDINHRRYRLHAAGGYLKIERGRYLPMGFESFVPKADALKLAYAPLKIPVGVRLDFPETFDDRADVDRALFSILAGWARQGMESNDPEDLKAASGYIERSEMLPGLSEEQRMDLKTLRADLAYRTGKRLLNVVVETLKLARKEFQLSEDLGTSRPTNAKEWLAIIALRLEAYIGQSMRLPNSTTQNHQGGHLDQKIQKVQPDAKLQHQDTSPQMFKQPKKQPATPEQKWRL